MRGGFFIEYLIKMTKFGLPKKWLNNSAFSLKSVMNCFHEKRGGMQGIFLLFKNVFNLDQYVFKLVRGSTNLLDNLV